MKTTPFTFRHKLLMGSVLAAISASSYAGGHFKVETGDDSYITAGVQLRAFAATTENAAPDGSASSDFDLNSTRFSIGGKINKEFGLYFGTEKMWGEYGVLDAIIQYEPSETFNVWIGRMLTPADRIEMNGPYYAIGWNQYNVPLYPSDWDAANGANGVAGTYGRDEGVTVWGSSGKFQYAVGIFDGLSGPANQSEAPLFATRLAYNFWTKENNPAYYTSGTYFGTAGDILTLGFSAQSQDDGYGDAIDSGSFMGYAFDLLFEKVLGDGAVVTIDGEYKDFTVYTNAAVPDLAMFDGNSQFVTAAYLLPTATGPGKFQPYVRLTEVSPDGGTSSDSTELGLNYVIDGHNAKFTLSYMDGYDGNSTVLFGAQLQL